MIDPWVYAALTATAVLTGFIDAIAGGGGLIMMPALLFAGVPPVNALATNKLQSMFGTATACVNYARKGLIDWRANRWTMLLVFLGASFGVIVVQAIDTRALSLIIPLLLMAVALYVLVSPRMGDEDAQPRLSAAGYAPVGAAIGAYDGFFGPGTGSFFTASLVALRGLGLTRATALTKLLNLTSNVAAVILFAIGGKMVWLLGLSMAAGSMTGGWIGSHTAMRFGARLIRPLLIILSLGLTARLLWGYFAG
ncbi:MAG: TSUP family transporter [Sphingomonas sp.]|uniref:TSUP family transporter n=1 Tax=Sphingomonas sp. TaxID=28214 RepID=UPI00184B1DA8|nr:TSUP family transporter [Sphingomonas sp.]MBA3668217.1 TSUP family transporter [Sphingomonas sp.]